MRSGHSRNHEIGVIVGTERKRLTEKRGKDEAGRISAYS
jgi:hypothetical protein